MIMDVDEHGMLEELKIGVDLTIIGQYGIGLRLFLEYFF